MTIALPALPRRIARLPKDERGYPVPRFVQYLKNGKAAEREDPAALPDFRYADFAFRWRAFHNGFCWVCGDKMGTHKVYSIGPMCVISRTTMEPACHRDCATFAARACPFLIHPREKRNAKGLEPKASAPGITIARNPGCVCLYETRKAKAFNPDDEFGVIRRPGDPWLIKLGPPDRTDWFAEGRQATRAEILASMESGYPLLFAMASKEGPAAIFDLGVQHVEAMRLLPDA